jgi:GntP family gluconate:H+ symporter
MPASTPGAVHLVLMGISGSGKTTLAGLPPGLHGLPVRFRRVDRDVLGTQARLPGPVVASHVNDSGFWLVGRFFDMDVKTTLKTWTVLETLIGLMGFAIAWVIFAIAGTVD